MNVTDIKPSSIRKYLYEYALIGLMASVIYLFVRVENLNAYIRNDLTSQKIKTEAALMTNEQSIKELLQTFKNGNNEQHH